MFQYTHDVILDEEAYWASCTEEAALDAFRVDFGSKASDILGAMRADPGVMARLASGNATYRWVPDADVGAAARSVGAPGLGHRPGDGGRAGGGRGRWRRQADSPVDAADAGGEVEAPLCAVEPDQTYTVSECAHLLKTSPRTVQRIALRLGVGRSRGPSCPVLLTGEEVLQIRTHREAHPPGRPGGRGRGRGQRRGRGRGRAGG